MYSYGISDKGLKRKYNEDSILINDDLNLYVVADGMGGHSSGDVASKIVVNELKEEFENTTIVNFSSKEETVNFYTKLLNKMIMNAREKIVKYATINKIKTIGTTVVGALINNRYNMAIIFHLGDSRAYFINELQCYQITTDHSKIEEMKQNGATQEELENVGKNIITKAIGNFEYFQLEINIVDLKKDDCIFLCSDGVSNYVSSMLLHEKYLKDDDLNTICDNLKQHIYTKGANDNLSMIFFEY